MYSKPVARAAFMTTPRRSFGANEKAINLRKKSVMSIEKITKAMKMVSASKMRGDLKRLNDGKNFGYGSVDMIFKSDTYLQRKAIPLPTDATEVIVPLSSDRGLCGGINSSVVREIKSHVIGKNRSKITIIAVGEKGTVGLLRPFPDMLKYSISDIKLPYNYPTIMAIA
jgi:F-type H+-transporting ATPase subunit gamma